MTPRLAKRWRKPMAQAKAIGKKDTPKARARAVHLWCLMAREAISHEAVSVPVSGVQPGPGTQLDPGPCPAVRGEDGAAPGGSDSPRVPAEGGSPTRDRIEESA